MGFLSELWDFVTDPIGYLVDVFAPEPPEPQRQPTGTTVTSRSGATTLPIVYTNYNNSFNGLKFNMTECHISSSGSRNRFLHLTYVFGVGEFNGAIGVKTPDFTGNLFLWSQPIIQARDYSYSEDTTQNVGPSYSGAAPLWLGFFGNANNTYVPSWHNDKNHYPGLLVFKVRQEYPPDNADPLDSMGFRKQQWDVRGYWNGFSLHHISRIQNAIPDGTPSTYSSERSLIRPLFHYLTDEKIGCGLDTSLFDLDSFRNAHRYYYTFRYNRYISYRLDPAQSLVTNVKNMLWHIGSTLIYENGKFVLRVDPNLYAWSANEAYDSTYLDLLDIKTYSIGANDIVGGVRVRHQQNSDIPYQIKTRYFTDKSEEFVYPQSPKVTNKILSQYYSGSPIFDVEQLLVDNKNIKEYSTNGPGAEIEHRYVESRYNQSITVTVSPEFSNIRVYDIINITYPLAELTNVRFVVTKITRNANMSLRLECKRYLRDGPFIFMPVRPLTQLILDQQKYGSKAKLLVPAGYSPTSNTQIDEFIPGTKFPTVENLTASSSIADGRLMPGGEWWPGVIVKFNLEFNSSVLGFNMYYRTNYDRRWRVLKDLEYIQRSTDGTFEHEVKFLSHGFTADEPIEIKVAPQTMFGTDGPPSYTTVVPVNFYVNRNIAASFDGAGSLPGYVLTEPNGILDQDRTQLSWIQLQGVIAPDIGTWGAGRWTPPTGIPADHTAIQTLSEAPQLVHELQGRWANVGNWFNTPAPGSSALSVNQEGEYTSPYLKVALEEGDEFLFTGSAEVGWYDASGDYHRANYSVGWKIYDSSNNLLSTFAPCYACAQSSAPDGGGPLIGNVANQAYALPTIYAFAPGTSSEDLLVLKYFKFRIHKNVQTSMSFSEIDTSTLPGIVGTRDIPNINEKEQDYDGSDIILDAFKKINNVYVTAHNSETKDVVGKYVSQGAAAYSQKVSITDINTGAATDAVINITFTGFPRTYNVTDENGVYYEYKMIGD